jgi:hypothetical protein
MKLPTLLLVACSVLALGGCSVNQIVARSSIGLVDAGVRSMNQEPDLELARAAIPANLKLAESLIEELPQDRRLRVTAAQGFYGYAYGFVEDDAPERAALLYKRGLNHALVALAQAGVHLNLFEATPEAIAHSIATLGVDAVPELFWTASNWAKWIDLNRNDPARIADLARVEALMQRVLALDPTYYFGGPHVFFGVFYGGRPLMLGGNLELSAQHFDQAAALSQHRWLLTDVLRAQYLLRQTADREGFHRLLTQVVASDDSPPDMALGNAIARAKARRLLSQEEELF